MPLDGLFYSNSIVLLTTDTCSNQFKVQTLGYSPYSLTTKGISGRIFILNNFLYIISSSDSITINKYNFYMKQIWSLTIPEAVFINYALGLSEILISSRNSLYTISESGLISESFFYSNIQILTISYFSNNIYASGQNTLTNKGDLL